MSDTEQPSDPQDPTEDPEKSPRRRSKNLLGFFLVMGTFVVLVLILGNKSLEGDREEKSLKDFEKAIENNEIEEVTCEGNLLRGKYVKQGREEGAPTNFVVHIQRE